MHGTACLGGCLDDCQLQGGAIIRFSPNCVVDIEQHKIGEYLVVVLRTLAENPEDFETDLVQCALVSRIPAEDTLCTIPVRQVERHELPFLKTYQSCLFMVDQPTSQRSPIPVRFSWTGQEQVEVTTIKRLPRRCLHKLPSYTALRLADFSLEKLLVEVDIADHALMAPLPQPNEFLTSNLFRIIEDLIEKKAMETQGLWARFPKRKSSSGYESGITKRRKRSIWDEGGVPRNGGQRVA